LKLQDKQVTKISSLILSVVVVMLGSNTVGYISNKETTYKDWQGYCKRLHSLGTNRS
jgi:hypothetical protein